MKTFVHLSIRQWIAGTALIWVALTGSAAIPPAEQLLPADTLGLVSIPDWSKVVDFYNQSPQGRLWQDPSLKSFRDNFFKNFKESITPLEQELGVKLSDYTDLVQGQVTLAVTQNGWDGKSDKKPGLVLLIDTKDKSDTLKKRLAELRQKWVDSGKQIKSEKIRDVDFTTLIVQASDISKTLEKAFPGKDKESDLKDDKNQSFELTVGQADSLLIAGNSTSDIEKVLNRKSGGSVPSLAEQSAYEANHSALFRDALAFVWVNLKPVVDVFGRQLAAPEPGAADEANPFAPKPDKIMGATGLSGLKTLSLKLGSSPEGTSVEGFLSAPESGRQGLLKIFAVESKDASPPPFVSADTVKYSRWRLDGQKAWTTAESMLTAISPQMASILQMGLATIGKDKDPNFDLKKSLIGNLGDDFISIEKPPRGSTLQELDSAPTLYLIGSPNPEKLALGLKAATSLLPSGGGEGALKERDFLGRKVYSTPLPGGQPAPGAPAGRQNLHFAASGGYLALSTDVAILEEFLRNGEASGKTLRETPGLADAAQKVGGMGTGFFCYENQSATMKATLEALKTDNASLQRLMSSLKEKAGSNGEKVGDDWFDFTLLPPFDQISKYFSYIVYSGKSTSDGLSWKLFSPTPPQMRK